MKSLLSWVARLLIGVVLLGMGSRATVAANLAPTDAIRVERNLDNFNPGRTEAYFFHGYSAGFTGVSSKQPGKEQDGEVAEVVMGYMYSCSNEAYFCLKTRVGAYAIPRTFSLDIRSYVVGGVTFTVLECQRRTETRCQVALIEADCQWLIDRFGECSAVSGGRSASPHPEGVRAFIYNEDFGITAMGHFAVEDIAGDRLAVARRVVVYTLSGNEGLLKPKKIKTKSRMVKPPAVPPR